MTAKRKSRIKRQQILKKRIEENPFITDDELSGIFGVSVPTIRLDRHILGIPELRERVKNVAQHALQKPIALDAHEVVGEILDLELNKSGLSILGISEDMVLEKTKIARGHFLFAQANSLAIAIIDAAVVLTGSARVRYKRSVYLHERVLAKAVVKARRGNTILVSVYSKVDREEVFKAQFVLSIQETKLNKS